jgi:hypothetical protein
MLIFDKPSAGRIPIGPEVQEELESNFVRRVAARYLLSQGTQDLSLSCSAGQKFASREKDSLDNSGVQPPDNLSVPR